jgi:hypothetical protein
MPKPPMPPIMVPAPDSILAMPDSIRVIPAGERAGARVFLIPIPSANMAKLSIIRFIPSVSIHNQGHAWSSGRYDAGSGLVAKGIMGNLFRSFLRWELAIRD